MVCLYCASQTKVNNSRSQRRSNSVWRRRECKRCNAVFTTVEASDDPQNLVVSINAQTLPFSRDRLLFTVYEAISHTSTAQDDASALTDTIIQKIHELRRPLISGQDLKGIVFETLDKFDKLAGMKYNQPSA